MPLKALAELNSDVLSERTDPGWALRYVDIGGVDYERGIHTVEEVTFADAPARARRKVQHGDTILSTVRTYLKAVAPVVSPPSNLIVSTGFAVLRPRPEVVPSFLSYALKSQSFIDEVVKHSTGVSYPAITPSVLAGLHLPVPGQLGMQRAIADYLDAETSILDQVRRDCEGAKRLAHERALAIAANAIAEAATSCPAVELRRVLRGVEQGWSPTAEDRPVEDGEWGVLKLSAVKRGIFLSGQHKALPDNLRPRTHIAVRDGDLLVTRSNTLEMVGDACVVRSPPPRLMLSDLIYRLLPDPERADPDYLCLWLLTRHARQQIEADARGTSLSMVKVSQDLLRRWLVPLPSMNQQRTIVARVRAAQADARSVMEDAEAAARLVAERRAALISAAVTGRMRIPSTGRRTAVPTLEAA